jgi:hypothetical protein
MMSVEVLFYYAKIFGLQRWKGGSSKSCSKRDFSRPVDRTKSDKVRTGRVACDPSRNPHIT